MKKNTLLYLFAVICLSFCANIISAKGIREKIADSYYENLAYKKALPYYVELAESKKATAEIVRKTADSYNKIGDTANAIKWYEALNKKYWTTTNDLYDYFLLLRKAGEYVKSLVIMNKYLQEGGTATDFITYLKENPNYVEELKAKSADKYTITTLPFNSGEHDFGATYYDKGILFASPEKRRERIGTPRKFAWDDTNFLQLYYVEKKGENNDFTKPKAFTELVKKDKFHDGPISFNSDFTEAYLTRSNYSAKGKLKKSEQGTVEVNLYISKKNENGKWSKLVPFQHNSSEYSTGCATLSKEGDIMVFATDMPGGEGETDLWVSKRDANGNWGTPMHLGNKINTSRRDNYPWLDKDGNLYFSSDGGIHGLGGYDVYWVPGFLAGNDKVYNVGAPINSEADDFGFVYNSDDATGYFNSGREGVVGEKGCDDIFAFNKMVSLVEVQIVDKATQLPITGALGCIKTAKNEPIFSDIKTNDETKFSKELKANTYIVCGNVEGYQTGETTVIVPKGKYVTAIVELEKIPEVVEEPKVPCQQIVLEDIYYDFGKYNIRGDASPALDELITFLKENPEAKVELSTHTDSRGTFKYNDWLSAKRAESAVNYLVARGIDRARLTSRGAGERELVNRCSDGVPCSEREHQANRRTEAKIIMDDCLEVNKKPNRYATPE